MSGFERIVELTPAYDRRSDDPAKNYGVHGVDLRMILKGEFGATQFALSTGWLLPETVGAETDDGWMGKLGLTYGRALNRRGTADLYPSPIDLGYHAYTPRYEGHEPMGRECAYLGGADCFYDGSGLNASVPFEALLREGHEGVWRVLADYYAETFAADIARSVSDSATKDGAE